MPIPYELHHLSKGKLSLSSSLFLKWKLNGDLVNYLKTFPGVLKLNFYPAKGKIIIYYKEEVFDLIDFLSLFERETEETLFERIGKTKAKVKEIEEKSSWFKRVTLTAVLYFLIGKSSYLLPFILLQGIPIFRKGFRSMKEKSLDVHFLDSLALLFALLARQSVSALFMIWLLALGDYLEEKVEKKAQARLKELFDNKEKRCYVLLENGEIKEIDPEKVKPGDKIVVYSGRKILVDGIIWEGEALINQSSLTGESKPVYKKKNDRVYAGTVVVEGKIIIQVDKTGDETVFAGIIRLIEEGIREPLSLQKKAEEESNKFVLPTLALGLLSLFGGLRRSSSVLTFDFYTGVHFVTPLTVINAATTMAKRNILMKSGAKFEKLAEVDTIIFDKTGTLTLGTPRICDIVCLDCSEEKLLQLAASLEQRIQHPVAEAIIACAEEKGLALLPRQASRYHLGLGIEGYLENNKYALGSTRFILKKKIRVSKNLRDLVDKFHGEGKSVLYLIEGDRKIKGLLTFFDPPRSEALDVVKTLKEKNLEVILCTGDNEAATRYLCQKLGIERFYARMMPQEKATLVKQLKTEGRKIAFIGDGLNDSPALSLADVGISFTHGAEVALEVADLVLTSNLWDLVYCLELSEILRKRLKALYKFNTFINGLGLTLATFGFINPAVSTLLNNGGTITMGLLALRDFKVRSKDSKL